MVMIHVDPPPIKQSAKWQGQANGRVHTDGDAILTRVLDCLDRKWPVIPLCWPDAQGQCACPKNHTNPKEIGKAPLLGKGYQEHLLTREEVEDYFRRYPHANYGIQLKLAQLLILDADSLEADREIEALGVPPGPRVRRGEHIHRYFKNDTGLCGVAIKKGKSGKIDILSNGYVVGPGSLHQSGLRYTEEVPFGKIELDSPPSWAVDLLREAGSSKNETAEIPQELPEVSIENLPVSRFVKALIRTGPAADPQKYPSRSEAVFAVLISLLHAGVTDTATLASILLNPKNAISEKPRAQGARWLASEISRARSKTQSNGKGSAPLDPEGSDEKENERILKAERPVEDVKEDRYPIYDGASLKNREFAPLKEAIADLLLAGLTVLAGAPKLGKSWLVLAIACAIRAGSLALSRFPVKQGDVLYLALEDSDRRMQRRLITLLGDFSEWPQDLPAFKHAAPLIGQGLEGIITAWLETRPNARLVIVDTFAKVKPPRRKNQEPYQEDYNNAARLQQLALKYGIAILLVHHTKKAEEEDYVSSVSGTYGVTGAADAVWVLKRKRGELEGTLSVSGRDIEERELAVKMVDCDWVCLGDATEVKRSESRKKILEALAHCPLTPAEITAGTGMKAGTVRQLLMKMLAQGEVAKNLERYSIPTNTP